MEPMAGWLLGSIEQAVVELAARAFADGLESGWRLSGGLLAPGVWTQNVEVPKFEGVQEVASEGEDKAIAQDGGLKCGSSELEHATEVKELKDFGDDGGGWRMPRRGARAPPARPCEARGMRGGPFAALRGGDDDDVGDPEGDVVGGGHQTNGGEQCAVVAAPRGVPPEGQDDVDKLLDEAIAQYGGTEEEEQELKVSVTKELRNRIVGVGGEVGVQEQEVVSEEMGEKGANMDQGVRSDGDDLVSVNGVQGALGKEDGLITADNLQGDHVVMTQAEFNSMVRNISVKGQRVQNLRRYLGVAALLVFTLAVVSFAMSWLAADTSKEVHVEGTLLVSTQGEPVEVASIDFKVNDEGTMVKQCKGEGDFEEEVAEEVAEAEPQTRRRSQRDQDLNDLMGGFAELLGSGGNREASADAASQEGGLIRPGLGGVLASYGFADADACRERGRAAAAERAERASARARAVDPTPEGQPAGHRGVRR